MNLSTLLSPKTSLKKPFYKTGFMFLSQPEQNQSLWLQWIVLCSKNQFKHTAEFFAILSKPNSQPSTLVIRESFDLSSFSENDETIQIGTCEIKPHCTQGLLQSKDKTLEWNLKFIIPEKKSIVFFPTWLNDFGILQSQRMTHQTMMLFSGHTQTQKHRIQWNEAIGMQGYHFGKHPGHSWTWAHAQNFLDEDQQPVPFIFEGILYRKNQVPFFLPQLASFYFYYENKVYFFQPGWKLLFLKTNLNLNEWTFQVEFQEICFKGRIFAEHKDFIGITEEDTQGVLYYTCITPKASMEIQIYRNSILEKTFFSKKNNVFEITSRNKNPYIHFPMI